jgi:hypothetical protein
MAGPGTQGNCVRIDEVPDELGRSINERKRAMKSTNGTWMNLCNIDERLNLSSINNQDVVNRIDLL